MTKLLLILHPARYQKRALLPRIALLTDGLLGEDEEPLQFLEIDFGVLRHRRPWLRALVLVAVVIDDMKKGAQRVGFAVANLGNGNELRVYDRLKVELPPMFIIIVNGELKEGLCGNGMHFDDYSVEDEAGLQ